MQLFSILKARRSKHCFTKAVSHSLYAREWVSWGDGKGWIPHGQFLRKTARICQFWEKCSHLDVGKSSTESSRGAEKTTKRKRSALLCLCFPSTPGFISRLHRQQSSRNRMDLANKQAPGCSEYRIYLEVVLL